MLKIYIGIDGKPEGPFAFEEIQQMIDKGQLTADSLAWWKGQTNWVKLGTLPGLQFDAVSTSDEPPSPDKEEIKPVEKQEYTEKESVQEPETHPETAASTNTGDITVPDFDIEPGPFLLAACRLLFTLKSVTFAAICLVFLITFFALTRFGTSDWLMVGYGVILYLLIAPVNGLFMKQFRGEPVSLTDIPEIILRNPLGYIALGAITQIPNILFVLLGDAKDFFIPSMICSSLFNLFFFYSTNLLIDKKLSVINSILFSIQAVLLHPFKTILFTFIQACVVVSGSLLFGFGLFITAIIAWSAGVYAYLWVFSRETIHEKFNPKY